MNTASRDDALASYKQPTSASAALCVVFLVNRSRQIVISFSYHGAAGLFALVVTDDRGHTANLMKVISVLQ